MKLAEIFSTLTHGELSNVHMGGIKEGEIQEEYHKRIVTHINLGLTALFTRFTLREGRVKVELQDGRMLYPIKSQFAVNNVRSKEPVRFIIDEADAPFVDDIIKIEQVYGDIGQRFALNDHNNLWSVFTPSALMMRIPAELAIDSADLPEELQTTSLELVYRANHPLLDVDASNFDVDQLDVELPYTHLQALCFFVASRVYNPVGMGQEFNGGNTYFAKYENECRLLEQQGMQVNQTGMNTRFQRNGFV